LYVANLQRDIVQLIDYLNEGQNSRGVNSQLSKMKETLDAINVKPEKGRRKDLRRIEQAVRSMRRIAFADKKDT
jgi:hypothetical protein